MMKVQNMNLIHGNLWLTTAWNLYKNLLWKIDVINAGTTPKSVKTDKL